MNGMLYQFKIRNFRSILDTEISFAFAEGKAPNNYKDSDFHIFLSANEKDPSSRVVPCMAFYGANASGKTNICKALFMLKAILKNGVSEIYNPNILNGKYDSTSFELSFFVNGKLFTYFIEYNEDAILQESLKSSNKTYFITSKEHCEFDAISTNFYTKEKLKEIFQVECQGENDFQVNAFFYTIGTRYAGLNADLTQALNFINRGIRDIYFNEQPILPYGIEQLADAIKEEAINRETILKAFNMVTKFIKKFDIDIANMTFEEDTVDPLQGPSDSVTFVKRYKNKYIAQKVYSWHKDITGKEIPLNFRDESDGTISVAGLIARFLAVLKTGGVLMIDELDKSLHPLILIELVRLFKDKRYNKGNAQLLFTTHSTDLLDADVLRVSEVSVINKSLKNGSTIKRISDFEGIRNVLNFRRQYLVGAFSGIPYPYI